MREAPSPVHHRVHRMVFGLLAMVAIACAKPATLVAGAISSVSGIATIERVSRTIPAVVKLAVELHDKLATGADGQMVVTLLDTSKLELGESSSLVIDDSAMSSSHRGLVSLGLGKLRATVAPLGSNSVFEVHTPNAVAAVRGTEFAVTYQPAAGAENSLVQVYKGKVAVSNPATPNVPPVLLNEGQQTSVEGAKPPAAPSPLVVAEASPAAAPPNVGTVQVSACQKIDKPGTYVVTKDLLSPTPCFPITTSAVTIDLGGHTIGGNGSYMEVGIQSQPPPSTVLTNITIKNGTVEHFYDAIDLNDSNNATVEGIKAIENGRNGISVTGTDATVRNCVVDKNVGTGIRAGNFPTLDGNTATNNEYGITASCPGTLSNNKAHNNSNTDIYLNNDPKRCTMTGNQAEKVTK